MAIAHAATAARPAVFLDRDGVINIDTGYAYRPEDLELTSTAAEGIRQFNEAGYWVIVVTNQSGVARGLYGEDDVHRFHDSLQERLSAKMARIDAFYHCPYHSDGTVARYAIDHEDRKPRPGMLLRALREWPITLQDSLMIGDKPSDAEAAAAAGVSAILVPANVCDLAATARSWLQDHPARRTALTRSDQADRP